MASWTAKSLKRRCTVILVGLAPLLAALGSSCDSGRAGLIFSGTFDSGGLGNWAYVMPSCAVGTRAPHITIDRQPTRGGNYVATVVASDSYRNKFGLEACELSDPPRGSYDLGHDRYYGVSYRFPSPYRQPRGWGAVIAQFGYTGTITSPPVSVALARHGLYLRINGGEYNPRYSGRRGLCGSLASTGYPHTCLWPGAQVVPRIVPDTWYELIIHVRWSTTGAGAIGVWVRREGSARFTRVVRLKRISDQTWERGVCDIHGLPMGSAACRPFDKIGVYRDDSAGSQPDTVVRFANFSYGTSYKVARDAFLASSGTSVRSSTLTHVLQGIHSVTSSVP